ncbi:hypothetical protein ACLB2K_046242 [Fragaria x ananassa]
MAKMYEGGAAPDMGGCTAEDVPPTKREIEYAVEMFRHMQRRMLSLGPPWSQAMHKRALIKPLKVLCEMMDAGI